MNKRTSLSTLIISLTVLTLTTGCSLLSSAPWVKANPSDGVTTTVTAEKSVTPPVSAPQAQAGASSQTSPTVGAETAVPAPAHHEADLSTNKLSGHLNGKWYIVKINRDNVADLDELPYLQFAESNHKIYAYDGCNVINAVYTLSGDNDITFADVMSTKRSCPDNTYGQFVMLVLRNDITSHVRLEHKDGHQYMTISTVSGVCSLTLRRDNLSELAGEWRVAKIDGKDIDEAIGMDLIINTDDMTLHGNTGCNYVNGVIESEAGRPGSITFSHMAVTMRACPNADMETKMLVALEQTDYYTLSHHSLHLMDSKGNTLMVLHKDQ